MATRRDYLDLAHAMQSGVAMKLNIDPSDCEPKHLRVGINAAMSDQGGLVELLISKGVFTEAEYLAAITRGMEREVASYEKQLSRLLQTPVTLA